MKEDFVFHRELMCTYISMRDARIPGGVRGKDSKAFRSSIINVNIHSKIYADDKLFVFSS